MSKVKKVRYFTKEKKALINEDNIKLYDKYLRSNIIKNKEVVDTTYKVYKSNMEQFMVFLAEQYDNVGLYDDELMEDAVDILEDYIAFCQETLGNNKKTINNKLAAISSFYHWSKKRKNIDYHPFDKQLERMKNANDEYIINQHYLTEEETIEIANGLIDNPNYDIQDRIIWHLMMDSCKRVGAISTLKLSDLNLEANMFSDIREKRGTRVSVVFEDSTKELIEQWLEQRKEMDNLEVDALFITKYDGEYRQMTKATIQNRVKSIGKIIGIQDFRSHSIRKTASNLIVEQTGDISLASSMLNHKSIDTTSKHYVKQKSEADTLMKIKELREKNKQEKERNKND